MFGGGNSEPSPYKPASGFYFRVDFLPPKMKGYAFREVSGIEAKIDITTLAEGGVNMFEHKLPGRTTYENLILKRGLNPIELTDPLYFWCAGTFNLNSHLMLPIVANPIMIISLLNEKGLPSAVWNFMNVYPVRWDVSDFNSEDGDSVVVEEIEFAYNFFARLPISGSLPSFSMPDFGLPSMAAPPQAPPEVMPDISREEKPLVAFAQLQSGVKKNGGSDGVAQASASGGTSPYTYAWDNGETETTATKLEAGIHVVTVTDSSGNTATAEVDVPEPEKLELTAEVHFGVLDGEENGEALAAAAGGTAPYIYKWDNEENLPKAEKLSAGIHIVTVTDASGDTAEAEVEIPVVDALEIEAAPESNVLCSGQAGGVAKAEAKGGFPPYSFLWDNGENAEEASRLKAGTHKVTVTDSRDNTAETEIEITEPPPLLASAKQDSPATKGEMDGKATVSVSGGTAPYTYLWQNGETDASATKLAEGVHVVKITDANGCKTETTVEIKEKKP